MKGNFRTSPLKIRVLNLNKKNKLTLGRFRSSFKTLSSPSFKHFPNKLYINIYNLEITPELLNKKLHFRLKNAYNKSIN